MSTYTWTQEGRRWTLDAAPRYAVQSREQGRYAMLIDGHEVDTADTLTAARARLECAFEYEEHGAELELARLRLRQARERLEARYPRAAKDPQLACILEGLGDALGSGPEASGPAELDALTGEVFRAKMAPDWSVVVDGSQCVTLEVTEGDGGRVLRRPTVAAVDYFKGVLDQARMAQQVALEEAGTARSQGLDEKRRAQGRLTRAEAVEWLARRGVRPALAANLVLSLREHPDESWTARSGEAMRFAAGYWVVPVSTPESGD